MLSLPSIAEACARLGFEGRSVISMHGPFCEDLSYGMMRQIDAAYIVTQDSGQAGGGFEEKVLAARRAGAKIVLIGRLPEEGGRSFSDVLAHLESGTCVRLMAGPGADASRKRRVTLAGIGMGGPGGMTLEVAGACRTADLVIGPEGCWSRWNCSRDSFAEYRPHETMGKIKAHPEHSEIVVRFSGDVGFYVGAGKLLEEIDRSSSFDVDVKCRASPVAYLCSRMNIPWQDVFLMSAHGRHANVPGEVRGHEKVFTLLDRDNGVRELRHQLEEYGLRDVMVTVGQDLLNENEIIVTGRPVRSRKWCSEDCARPWFRTRGTMRPAPSGCRTTSSSEGTRR